MRSGVTPPPEAPHRQQAKDKREAEQHTGGGGHRQPWPRQVAMSSRHPPPSGWGCKRELPQPLGKRKLGNQAPPSITIKSVARMARPRVASGPPPRAAMKRPKAAGHQGKGDQDANHAGRLPCTLHPPAAAMATSQMTLNTPKQMRAVAATRLPSKGTARQYAARRRFQSPRRCMTSRPDGHVHAEHQQNCTPMPAKLRVYCCTRPAFVVAGLHGPDLARVTVKCRAAGAAEVGLLAVSAV